MVWCRIGIADSRSDLIEPDMIDCTCPLFPCDAGDVHETTRANVVGR